MPHFNIICCVHLAGNHVVEIEYEKKTLNTQYTHTHNRTSVCRTAHGSPNEMKI